MQTKRLSILLSLIALGSIALVLAVVLFIQKSSDDKMAHAQFQPEANIAPEEAAPVEIPFDKLEAEVRARIANLPPLEAAQYLLKNTSPSFSHLVLEVLDPAIQQREGLDRALQKKLDLPELLMLRGQVYYSQVGDYAKARNDFARVVQLDPQLGEAHAKLGGVLVALGETDAALVALNQALALGADTVQTRYNLAHAYYQKGEKNLAVENFKKVVEMDSHTDARIYLEMLGVNGTELRRFL